MSPVRPHTRFQTFVMNFIDEVADLIIGEPNNAFRQDEIRKVDHTLRDFRRNGIELSGEKQQRLRTINQEIT